MGTSVAADVFLLPLWPIFVGARVPSVDCVLRLRVAIAHAASVLLQRAALSFVVRLPSSHVF